MKLGKFNVTLKRHTNYAPKTHFIFEFIGVDFINTIQVWSIRITVLSITFKILYNKENINYG